MPVVSMLMRFLMGMVQAFETPGMRSASFISVTSWSVDMWSGVMCAHRALVHCGQLSYHVATLRHWDFGFSEITVSIMENGAGSVDVSARPALPNTRSTSGNRIRIDRKSVG